MFVKVYDIPVEILSFDEESSTIYTKQVPLSLRRFIRQILVERQKVNIEDYFIKTTVEIKDKEFVSGIYLRRNPSSIYTLPDPKKHWINQELEQEEKLKNLYPVNQLLIRLGNEI